MLLSAGLLMGSCLFADVQLIKNGKSEYSVFVVDAKDEISKLAASELISYLKKSTGVELKQNNTGKKRIVIGLTPELKKKLGRDLPAHGELRIRTIGDDLYLYGGGKFGNMYAVSTFLEKFAGVRWFNAYKDGTCIPQKKEITLKNVDIRQKPGFKFRAMANWYIHAPKKDVFYLHNKINFNEFSAGFSDIKQNYAQCHTLFSYIRPYKNTRTWKLKWPNKEETEKVYFKSNPEYFSMNQSGQRVANMQLCFSNPGLRKELLRRLEVQFQHTGKGVYSLSAMDWPGKFCFCKDCKALEAKYQCTGAPLYDFLLEAAEMAKKKYPGVYLSTLAYRKGQSEFPPVMGGKFPDNIIIIFAPVNDDVTKTFAHKNNQGTYENLKKWTKLSDNVWVWYYVYHSSMEGITKRLAEDTRLMHKAGAVGNFYEYTFSYAFSGIATDEMTIYIAMKLYWDPASDWKKHREDYCRYFYGSAADSIMKWLDERDAFTAKIPVHMFWSSSSNEWGYYKNTENIIREQKLIESWMAMTKNEPFAHNNIKRLRLAVDKITLINYPQVRKLAPEYKGRSQQIYQRLLDDVKTLADMRKINYNNLIKFFVGNSVKTALKLAEIEPKPLPADLKTDGKRVVRYLPDNRNAEKIMPDAAWGFTYGKEIKNAKTPFPFGYYDVLAKVQKNFKIPYDKIKKDGKFHLYYLTTTSLSASCRVWCHPSWGLGYGALGELFDIDNPKKEWKIYVSLKFTGPAYQKTPETQKNMVWIDQVISVEK